MGTEKTTRGAEGKRQCRLLKIICNNKSPAIRRCKGLWGIVIIASVNLTIYLIGKFTCLIIKSAHHIYYGTFSCSHWRYHQHIFISYPVKIRALPHISPLAPALCQNIEKCPVDHIVGAVQKRLRFIISAVL